MTQSHYCNMPRSAFITRCRWLCVPVILAAVGCQDYRWRWDYEQAEQDARQQEKHLFIFYKHWLNDESNRMHREVLADPAVGALFQDTINLLLEKDSAPEYAKYLARYGVTSPPAFVVVAPDGTYRVQTGFIPKDRFIEFIKQSKATRPASEPRASPGPRKT